MQMTNTKFVGMIKLICLNRETVQVQNYREFWENTLGIIASWLNVTFVYY